MTMYIVLCRRNPIILFIFVYSTTLCNGNEFSVVKEKTTSDYIPPSIRLQLRRGVLIDVSQLGKLAQRSTQRPKNACNVTKSSSFQHNTKKKEDQISRLTLIDFPKVLAGFL